MYETIRWQEAWNTGIDTVDRQHRQLADELNRIMERALHLDDETDFHHVFTTLLDEFIILTREHFRYEEETMRQVGYPHLSAHKSEHALLIAELGEFVNKMKLGQLRADMRLQRDLRRWFIAHMVISDQEFARYYHARP